MPGRLCLFGEHTDWAGTYMSQNSEVVEGQAIVSGINLGIYADAFVNDKFKISMINDNGDKESLECDLNIKTLKDKASEPILFSYCCGVAAYMVENYQVGGIEIIITKTTLPMKKGLSSSAAVCCLVAKAFNDLYDLHISTRGIMQIAYRGELLTGSRCGRLDQACAYGERPVLMHFAYNEIDVDKIRVGSNLYWVVADLCAGKNTKKILAYLNKAYPFATGEIEEKVQEALGEDNHKIIAKAYKAIEEGNSEELGKVMTKAQEIFDNKVAPACPDELSSPVLHSVLNDPEIKKWIYGAKGVGSQGDGTVQLLARDKKSQMELVDYLNDVRKMEAFPFVLRAGGKVRKAIIPIAGNGTRMFPETLFIKKAFLPVIDSDGITKPVLLCMLEELVEAGIEDIYLIVGEGEEESYKKIFSSELDNSYRNSLPAHLRSYYDAIHEIGHNLHFVIQKEKKGFGHAIYQAKEYVNDEPVLLLLGDFIYTSNLDISCTKQTINAYNKSGGKNIIAIKKVPYDDAPNYGIVTGQFDEKRSYLMDVKKMIEKPSVEVAKNDLSIGDNCYATFGQYVLTSEIFEYLENQITSLMNNELPPGKEIDLTSALSDQAEKGMLVGVEVDGTSYDVGIPSMYYNTFVQYNKSC